MDYVELSVVGARPTPRHDVLAVCRVLVDAAVGVAVGHEQISVRGICGDVRAPVERVAGERRRGLVGDSDCHQHLAVERALPDRVVAVVGAVEGVVRPHADAVRAGEQALSPSLDEVAILVEYDHWVIAPAEHVNVIFLVRDDSRHLSPAYARRQLLPSDFHFISQLPCSQFYRADHAIAPLL